MLRSNRKIIPICKRLYSTQAKTLYRSESPVSQALKLNVGEKLFGYTVKQVEEVSELQLAAVRLNHDKTGADHLHIAREDKNNLFSVALRTTPKDSKGIMHILEHITLSGSQKYPVRDAFMKMLNRSLATFMNAYTGPDYTMYLFSSQNMKDFENLLQVYLDAVFFPGLGNDNFRSEGWRLEHEVVDNQSSPIILKGVVFNEMKGVFSDPCQLYGRCLLNKLYPTSYPHESGGDPLEIPNLTWNELKQYHAKYYHPSNSRFFTYGDQPLEVHLQAIEDLVLKKLPRIEVHSAVPNEVHWSSPKEDQITCRFDPLAAQKEKQCTASISYLLNDTTDTYETLAMSIIGNLLVDGPNAPFYKSLLQPGIGSDYSPWTGHDGSLKNGFFSVGLREIAEKDINLVKNTVESTIEQVIRSGFPQERIEGVLHNIELGLKHQKTNFGHNAAMAINSNWNHGGNPVLALKVNDHIQWFQKQLTDNPSFLQQKVEKYLKKNSHKLFLSMKPDENYETKLRESEKVLLQSKVEALTAEEKLQIYNDGLKLAKLQEEKEDISCLPTLSISDVQRELEKTDLQFNNIENVSVQYSEQPTNGVTYFAAFSRLPFVPDDLLMLLPLFSEVVTKMGAGDKDFMRLDQVAELKTGGLNASLHISSNPSDADSFELGVLFSSHCLQKNTSDMMKLWEDIFNSLRLSDKDRLNQLIKLSAADLAQSIPGSGHRYSIVKASSTLSLRENIKERLSGLTQVAYMKKLAELNNCDEVIEKLRTLSSILLNKNSLRCFVNSTPDSIQSSLCYVENFIKTVKLSDVNLKSASTKWDFSVGSGGDKHHFVLPFNVNYLGKCIRTVPYNHKDFATLKVASKLMSSKFLHPEIREKGGAYGGGSSLKQTGAFVFYSYRDPNVKETIRSFDAGSQWLLRGDYTQQDINEAKLGVFGEIDHPISPGSRGSLHFLHGITDEMKQILRQRVFDVSKEDIISATERHLSNPKSYGIALIGPEQEVTKNSEWVVQEER